jgi:hypothetical protein
MLIMTPHLSVTGGAIDIPAAIRAPLYLDSAPHLYGSLATGSGSQIVELVASPFPPHVWSDLWSVELDVINTIGVLSEIVSLLTSHNIGVLAAEASVIDLGDRGTISLIVELLGYESPNDGNSRYRSQAARVHLPDLQARIATTFIHDLVFADGHSPRIHVRRVHSHHALHQNIVNAHIMSPEEIAISAGQMMLGTKLRASIDAHLNANGQATRVMFLADARDRVLRGLFSCCDRGIVNVRVFFRTADNSLADVLNLIHKASFDIVRCVRQPGLPRAHDDLATSAPSEYATIDLTLQSTIDDPSMDEERLLNLIRAQLTGARELAYSNVVVTAMPPLDALVGQGL